MGQLQFRFLNRRRVMATPFVTGETAADALESAVKLLKSYKVEDRLAFGGLSGLYFTESSKCRRMLHDKRAERLVKEYNDEIELISKMEYEGGKS